MLSCKFEQNLMIMYVKLKEVYLKVLIFYQKFINSKPFKISSQTNTLIL